MNYLLVYIEFAWETSWRICLLFLCPLNLCLYFPWSFGTFYISVLSRHSTSTLKKHVYLRFWESSPVAIKRKGRSFFEWYEADLKPLDASKYGKCIVQTKLILANIDHNSWHKFNLLYIITSNNFILFHPAILFQERISK